MNLADLHLVLTTRAQADNGSGGLFNSGTPLVTAWYPGRIPEDTAYPFVVQSIAGPAGQHAFNLDVGRVSVRFVVYVPRESESITDPLQRASDILARIYGNWSSASPSTVPTRGFHRFKPTLASPWTATHMLYVDTFDESDADFIQLAPEFQFFISQ